MLRVDLWPAECHLPNGQFLPSARVCMDISGKVVVFLNVTGVVKPVYVGRLIEDEDTNIVPERGAARSNSRLQVRITNGQAKGLLIANQTAGCGGCGNQLANVTEQDVLQADRALV